MEGRMGRGRHVGKDTATDTAVQTFRFVNAKAESLFLQRKNPRKIAWTQVYRRYVRLRGA